MNAIIQTIGGPILVFLEWFYELIPSLGVAIIVLTFVVNMLLFPLVLKQTRSTKAFQKIGPEIKKLQEKYKDEPQKLQEEMVALQREHGATPGGCLLPMLVQLPIWWALFRVLRDIGSDDPEALFTVHSDTALGADIADGNAYFLGSWFGSNDSTGLLDLTATPSEVFSSESFLVLVPYLVLILLMVLMQFISQLVQQRYNESGTNVADNPQAKQMQVVTKVMPVMFGVFAWNFVAGLTVYWTTSSLVRLGQQRLISVMDARREEQAAAAKASEKPAVEAGDNEEEPKKKPQQGSAKKQQRRRRRRS